MPTGSSRFRTGGVYVLPKRAVRSWIMVLKKIKYLNMKKKYIILLDDVILVEFQAVFLEHPLDPLGNDIKVKFLFVHQRAAISSVDYIEKTS